MKKKLCLTLMFALLLCLLSGCGASSSVKTEQAYDYAVAETAAASASLAENGMDASATLPEGRKWIITIDMNIETEDLDTLMEQLNADIDALEGYVEDQNIHNGSTYSSRRYRSANLTVRIPDENVDRFTAAVEGLGNVVSQNLRREDITLQYVDTASRVTALETEEARLLELLAKAETMEDLLEIEARLTDVRYELENYASQLRLYDNQVDYATIYLYIEEVQEYTPVEEPTLWERISGGFMDSLKGLWEGLLDICVWVIANSPYLVVYGGIAAVVFRVVKKLRIRRKKKEDKA